jgi:hypothetical protein
VFILSVFRTSAKKRSKKIIKKQPSAAPSPPYLLSFRFHLLRAAFVFVFHTMIQLCIIV